MHNGEYQARALNNLAVLYSRQDTINAYELSYYKCLEVELFKQVVEHRQASEENKLTAAKNMYYTLVSLPDNVFTRIEYDNELQWVKDFLCERGEKEREEGRDSNTTFCKVIDYARKAIALDEENQPEDIYRSYYNAGLHCLNVCQCTDLDYYQEGKKYARIAMKYALKRNSAQSRDDLIDMLDYMRQAEPKNECVYCGNMLSSSANYCDRCGNAVHVQEIDSINMQDSLRQAESNSKCAFCDALLASNVNYCAKCGRPVSIQKKGQ